jgi:hypothetical protein
MGSDSAGQERRSLSEGEGLSERTLLRRRTCPGYRAYPLSREASMPTARTYFLENIAKDEERRYSLFSSVTACLE